MQRLVYAGSFDPITLGHIDVVRQAHKLCNQVVVLIANNPDKKPMFTWQERMTMAMETLEYCNLDHVYVMKTSQYVAEWCRPGDVLVRGIRDAADLKLEMEVAAFNRNPKVPKESGRVFYADPLDTIWLPSQRAISSTQVKAMAKLRDPDLAYAVAPSVAARLKEKVGV